MDQFTTYEYADIVFIYGFCDGNTRLARNEYHRRFPNRIVPSRAVFSRTFQRFRETGSSYHNRRGAPRVVNIDGIEDVLNMVRDNPGTSTRRISLQLGLSQNFVWRTLHTNEFHPYHYQRVQALEPGDAERRLQFCRWILNKFADDPNFVRNIIWTDEATFTRDGINNHHNKHLWSLQNPHAIKQARFQRRFSINVWAGILNNRLVGMHFLNNRMNAQYYLNFLETSLTEHLDDLPLNIIQTVWFQHDGAPPHNARHVTEWLNRNFGNNWIGNRGPILWPPRSPDLNPLDFYFWGHLKQLVYCEEINNIQHLTERINNSLAYITNNGDMAEINNSVIRRCQACIRAQGGHFEQLLF